MKDITKIRKRLEKELAKKHCHVSSIEECPREGQCTCKVAAEVQAYIESVIPEGFRKMSFDDFNGVDKEGNVLLEPQIALRAKKNILSYCWEGVKIEDLVGSAKIKHLDKYSIIDKRLKDGDNVVIYDNGFKKSAKASGKTFVASLIMREAIKRRYCSGDASTYAWTSYASLVNKLKKDTDFTNSDSDLTDIKYCDWLVIDDMRFNISTSRRSMNYTQSLLEPFFYDRFENNLPTIFVFNFDIKIQFYDNTSIEDLFGITVDKIINNSRTCIVSLFSEGNNGS